MQQAPPTGHQASGAAAWSAAAVTPAAPPALVAAMTPPPRPPLPESTSVLQPAAKEEAADALQGALAGLLPVRKAVMRGPGQRCRRRRRPAWPCSEGQPGRRGHTGMGVEGAGPPGAELGAARVDQPPRAPARRPKAERHIMVRETDVAKGSRAYKLGAACLLGSWHVAVSKRHRSGAPLANCSAISACFLGWAASSGQQPHWLPLRYLPATAWWVQTLSF